MDAACRRGKIGSMRQIQNLPSTPGCRNASTCGFSTRKGRHARGFWNLPHTSDRRFRKCEENQGRSTRPRFYAFATYDFVAKNRVVLGGFRFFPALPENAATPSALARKTRQIPLEQQPLKRKNRLSAVFTDQAGRTVARPLQRWTIRRSPAPVNP